MTATTCDQHGRIRRQGRVDGMRDIEIACARSYRLGAFEGSLRAVLALLLLAVAAHAMRRATQAPPAPRPAGAAL